jgi:hypothetical protein
MQINPKIHLWTKSRWYIFSKSNGQTVGGKPIYGHPGGSNTQSHLLNTNILRRFWWKCGYSTPRLTTYWVTLHCLAIHFDEIISWFVPNVFLWICCIIKWSKLGIYLHYTNIWHHLWSIFGYLTPGVTIYRVPLLFAHSFWKNPIMICPKCIFVVTYVIALWNGSNWEVICIIPIFGIFLVKMWVFDPLGWPYIWLPPTVCQLILKKYHHALS